MAPLACVPRSEAKKAARWVVGYTHFHSKQSFNDNNKHVSVVLCVTSNLRAFRPRAFESDPTKTIAGTESITRPSQPSDHTAFDEDVHGFTWTAFGRRRDASAEPVCEPPVLETTIPFPAP